ncbi:MAG: cytochrome c biogenesis protein CcsA [Actinomycetota bacterium]|nr:cytochrome c biogenesis protein CcsA [Actinomycetota bacterium]
MNPVSTNTELTTLLSALASIGGPLQWALLASAVFLGLVSFMPSLKKIRERALCVVVGLLATGEVALIWFHWRLYAITAVVSPVTGETTGHVAVSMWVESEKLFVWALILGLMALFAKRHRSELLPGVCFSLALITIGAVLWGQPFTEPLPQFLGQYRGYLAASGSGDINAAMGAYQGMESSRAYYYNTWYMWVHPPLLFISYGAFVMSFVSTIFMWIRRHSSYEETAYRWARLGYLPLTFGMLLGFPWAILAWQGESWWWSGKVNMSIMMWLLYTAYLHGRLYLRRKGMWRVVAILAMLSFLVLVLTYMTTYIVPGAHSYA